MAKPAPYYFIKRNGKLEPASQFDDERLNAIPDGKEVCVERLDRKRSVPMNRKYWACLKEIVDATECTPSPEYLHEKIKIDLGYISYVIVGDEISIVPDSTRFEKMDDTEFLNYIKQADKWCLENLGFPLMRDKQRNHDES